MKIAISLPDPLFEEAEKLAGELRISRSELYARALESFVGRMSAARIREQLDAVYGGEDRGTDPELEEMALSDLPEERW